MKLLVVTADYSNWMYKSLYDEQQALFNYLKKKIIKFMFLDQGKRIVPALMSIFLKKKIINQRY